MTGCAGVEGVWSLWSLWSWRIIFISPLLSQVSVSELAKFRLLVLDGVLVGVLVGGDVMPPPTIGQFVLLCPTESPMFRPGQSAAES